MALKKLTWWDKFKVADESTDIRGWRVHDRRGEEVGKIDDLIFDTDDRRVRYVSIAVDEDVLERAGRRLVGDRRDREVLVPVGGADVIQDDRLVRLRELDADALAAMPVYTGDTELDPAVERDIYQACHPSTPAVGRPDYSTEPYNTTDPRFLAIEERYASIMSAPQPATFSAAEPDREELERRHKARDASGDWPA